LRPNTTSRRQFRHLSGRKPKPRHPLHARILEPACDIVHIRPGQQYPTSRWAAPQPSALPPSFICTITSDIFAISYGGDAKDFTSHTEIDIKSSVPNALIPITSGNSSESGPAFTWANVIATGMVHIRTTTSVLDVPLVFGFPMDNQYGSQTPVLCMCWGRFEDGEVGGGAVFLGLYVHERMRQVGLC
jgi:hypothetical protein